MPITVVGSIAYDSVSTPFGERQRMLGGAAVHFALAASFFEEVRVVGPVGEDFGETELDVLRNRGVDISDVERVEGGKTFFWRGKYGWDLNSRETLDTQLGVFEGFQPKLSESSRASEVLFLANIQPDLQRDVRAQLPDARFVALDSMNLWIEAARESLMKAIAECDCLILNDSELRQLTGKASLYAAAREILSWSPPHPGDRRQAGRVRRGARHRRRLLLAARLPAGVGRGPHRRRRHVRGRVRRVRRRAHRGGAHRRAAAPGDGARHRLASFNVEEFGTQRIETLSGAEIVARVRQLREFTQFSAAPVPLGD